MHLTKHLLQESSGVTFTVVIRPWPQTQEAHSTKDSIGGREGWSRREEGVVLLSSHTVEHEIPAKLQTL